MCDGTCPSIGRPIRLIGSREASVTEAELFELPHRVRDVEIVCATGDRYTERWQGVPVTTLLDRMAPPPKTTHLLVVSRDGYRACIGIDTALDGLVAVDRGGRPLSTIGSYDTRFVAAGTAGSRTVKGVERIEARALAPGDNPDAYERLPPE
jgi:DMSO/TMAO reductase YedYZ molybdopterin-dependent catalytic subunit